MLSVGSALAPTKRAASRRSLARRQAQPPLLCGASQARRCRTAGARPGLAVRARSAQREAASWTRVGMIRRARPAVWPPPVRGTGGALLRRPPSQGRAAPAGTGSGVSLKLFINPWQSPQTGHRSRQVHRSTKRAFQFLDIETKRSRPARRVAWMHRIPIKRTSADHSDTRACPQ